MMPSPCSLTEGVDCKTEHPLINHTFIAVKNEISVKDEYNHNESFAKFSNNSDNKFSHSVEDSSRHVSSFWNVDKHICQVDKIKTESVLHTDEIKAESDHGMTAQESKLMITDIRTLLPREDNVSDLKISISPQKVTLEVLQDYGQSTLVNPITAEEVAYVVSTAQNVSARIHARDESYRCTISGESFADKQHLNTQDQRHTSEKSYRGHEWGKSFTESKNLANHKWIHPGEKPYKCKTCGKSYTYKKTLKIHYQIHTGEKPYRCKECESHLLKIVP